MSERPTGITILAILQLLSALADLFAGVLVLMDLVPLGILAIFGAWVSLIVFILGIIGLVLFYGLWTLKSWAWLGALIFSIVGIIIGIMDPIAGILTPAVSIIIVIYLLFPGTRDYFR
ncbi:MAG: hypothetical protein GQ580_06915 [Candidatus Thorarchaeota archaeon]|nr:hypothetical protein [Candidatus Thorarchaeota archaeon]